ncbi:MAG: glycosyltransferase family 4 protein [Sphingopyxis sp.]|uniref:glycosyltransferase family 4 protein n=1 Tax=Sphingopyxis sp. TaxID=1908224 RepID=UPI001A6394C8|nr:glycosyltransferase family 4 protein [Sphingopyxis sp.]MBL9067143.1 glycosyltransferase family 4 protein [Sphingopyxis sp.]
MQRVLVIAEAANPDWVSVPLVGWNIAVALRGVADVHIVTQVRNRAAFLSRGLVEGRDFTAIDSEAFAAPFYRLAEILRGGDGKGWTTITAMQSLAYPYFEHLVWRRFGNAIKAGKYDVVHRVTPLSPTAPSSLARRCRRAGVPFLLGPLNGGLPWHPDYGRERIKEREWLSYIRKAYAFLPTIRSTYANASAIIAGSGHTSSELARYRRPMVYIPENGIDTDRFGFHPRTRAQSDPLRLIFVGRLVPYKGADIAIEACQGLLKTGRARLDIIGDGPEGLALAMLVAKLGVEEAVTLHGWKSHAEVADYMRKADLMVFPSVREFGGGVVLEAMASGVVPIVVDYGGPGELVDNRSGFAIPIGPRDKLVRLVDRLTKTIVDGDHDLTAMSAAAANRVEQLYSWRAKANQIRGVYDWLRQGDGTVPDFGFSVCANE